MGAYGTTRMGAGQAINVDETARRLALGGYDRAAREAGQAAMGQAASVAGANPFGAMRMAAIGGSQARARIMSDRAEAEGRMIQQQQLAAEMKRREAEQQAKQVVGGIIGGAGQVLGTIMPAFAPAGAAAGALGGAIGGGQPMGGAAAGGIGQAVGALMGAGQQQAAAPTGLTPALGERSMGDGNTFIPHGASSGGAMTALAPRVTTGDPNPVLPMLPGESEEEYQARRMMMGAR